MKAIQLAVLLTCSAAASLAQSPAEKPVNENFRFRSVPRFSPHNDMVREPAHQPVYRHVRPPVQNVSVAWKVHEVPSAAGGVLSYPSGTKIQIPADAFMDKNGYPVTGQVTIRFREFKNPVDFLFSGIPMNTDSAGAPAQFVSAGMFEIAASVGGEEVFLKPGKQVDVQMSSVDPRPDYNLYAFNDETGKWDEKADRSQVKVETRSTTPGYSKAISAYMAEVRRYRGGAYDTNRIETRFNSPNYMYTQYMQKGGGAARWREGRTSYRALIRIANVSRTQNGEIVFRVLRNCPGTHRELQPLQNIYWKFTGKGSLDEFRRKTNNLNNFSDIRIRREGDSFVLLLKNASGFREIEAVPVLLSSEKIVSAYHPRTVQRIFNRYHKMRMFRERQFDAWLVKGRLQNNRLPSDYNAYCVQAWKNSMNQMTEAEREMEFDDWNAWVRKNPESYGGPLSASDVASTQIVRTFSIGGMGIWNCDQIKRVKNPVSVMASYKLPDGMRPAVHQVYVVDRRLNSVLTYYGGGEITFSRTSETCLVVILNDGTVSVVLPEYMKSQEFQNKSLHTFTLKRLGSASDSMDELKLLAGI